MLTSSNYRVILVTGPQRSGTTIASRMVADTLGYRLYDELDWGVHNESDWRSLVDSANKAVIHCPTMMHKLVGLPDDVLAMVMIRPLADILVSQRRIDWCEDTTEANKFGASQDSAKAKYEWWDKNKHKIKHIEVEYGSSAMSQHPFWVEKTKRHGFKPKQTSI